MCADQKFVRHKTSKFNFSSKSNSGPGDISNKLCISSLSRSNVQPIGCCIVRNPILNFRTNNTTFYNSPLSLPMAYLLILFLVFPHCCFVLLLFGRLVDCDCRSMLPAGKNQRRRGDGPTHTTRSMTVPYLTCASASESLVRAHSSSTSVRIPLLRFGASAGCRLWGNGSIRVDSTTRRGSTQRREAEKKTHIQTQTETIHHRSIHTPQTYATICWMMRVHCCAPSY